MQDFNNAINLKSDYAKAYCDRGVLKADLKNYKDAIEDYSKAIVLYSKFDRAYFCRGNSKYLLGDKNGACLDWKKAIELGYAEAKENISTYCK